MSNEQLSKYHQIIIRFKYDLKYCSYFNFMLLLEQSVIEFSKYLHRRDRFKIFNLKEQNYLEIYVRDIVFSKIALGMEPKKEFIENFYFTYYANKNEFLPYLKANQEKFNYVLSASLYLKSEKIFNDILSIKKSKIKDFIINFLIYYIEKNKSFEHFKDNHLFILLLEKFEINDYLQSIVNNLTFKSQEYHDFLKSIYPFFEMINNKKLLNNF